MRDALLRNDRLPVREAMSAEPIPVAIAEATFRLFDTDVRCYVLDNGLRIINADDFADMMTRMDGGAVADPDDISAFASWRLGK